MLTIRSKKFGDVWVAVAENETGDILSSSFSLDKKRDAMNAVMKTLPRQLRCNVKEKMSFSSATQVMYELYRGKNPRKQPRLDMRFIPPFTRNVYQTTRRIPRGFVTTYGTIAAHVSNRYAQRAVGNAMKRNPFTLLVPCHRVIPSTLDLGRYSLSRHADSNSIIKRALLAREGVEFNGDKVSRRSIWSFKRGFNN